MSMKSQLGSRKNVTPLRALLIVLIGFIVAVLMNMFVWGGDAKASDCVKTTHVAGWVSTTSPCTESFDDIISPDARQAMGNAATACGLGWWLGGPTGCGYGALGSLFGSIPWDGTWD